MVKRGPCHGLKHQKEKRSMDHFAGLDVSVKETSVCIVDDTGRIVREVKVESEPEDLLRVLANPDYHFKRTLAVLELASPQLNKKPRRRRGVKRRAADRGRPAFFGRSGFLACRAERPA